MNLAETYILKQPEPYKSILIHLQILVEHTLPEAELLYKWRIPCYYIGKRPICYLNQSKDYIDVGIWHSAHLSKKWDAYLRVENRKVVKSLRYRSGAAVAFRQSGDKGAQSHGFAAFRTPWL